MKILIIGNPVSGDGKAARRIGRLVEVLTRRGHVVQAMLTQQAEDTHRFAREIRPGQFDRLVVAGGDGTLNGVLNGLTRPDLLPIVPLSSGTANLLARELRLPQDPAGLADVLEHGIVRRLDMGLINGQRFLLVASAGFDAMVIEEIHRNRKGRLGFRGYPLPIWRVFRRYEQPVLRVVLDDELEARTGGMVVVSNTRVYAGILSITDRAVCDSGHWDVCVIPQATALALLRLAVSAFRRTVSRRPDLSVREVYRRIVLESATGARASTVEHLARTGRERLEAALANSSGGDSARTRATSEALVGAAEAVLGASGSNADLIAASLLAEPEYADALAPLAHDPVQAVAHGREPATAAVATAEAVRRRQAAVIPDPIHTGPRPADTNGHHAVSNGPHRTPATVTDDGVRGQAHGTGLPGARATEHSEVDDRELASMPVGGHSSDGDRAFVPHAVEDVRRGEIPIEVDGEYFGHTPAIIELIPGLVPVVAPAPRRSRR